MIDLKFDDEQKLIIELNNLPEWTSGKHGRRAVLLSVGLQSNTVQALQLNGPPRIDAQNVITHLKDIGHLSNRPEYTALGALVDYLLNNTPHLEGKEFLAYLLDYYQMIDDTDKLEALRQQYSLSCSVSETVEPETEGLKEATIKLTTSPTDTIREEEHAETSTFSTPENPEAEIDVLAKGEITFAEVTTTSALEKEIDVAEPSRPPPIIPSRTWWLLALLAFDFCLIIFWGWCLIGNQPNLVTYLGTVFAIVAVPIVILTSISVIRRPIVWECILHNLGANRRWIFIIGLSVLIFIATSLFWPLGLVGKCGYFTPIPTNTPTEAVTLTPTPTPTHRAVPTRITKVVIEIDEKVIDTNNDHEVTCDSNLRIEVKVLDVANNILSYNWRFNPGNSDNNDKIGVANNVINYNVPCDLDRQTVTIEVLEDRKSVSTKNIDFSIKK